MATANSTAFLDASTHQRVLFQYIPITTGDVFNPAIPTIITAASLAQTDVALVILDARLVPAGGAIEIDLSQPFTVLGAVRAGGNSSSQWLATGTSATPNGAPGNEVTSVLNGDDIVYGTPNNDFMFGGSGNDVLLGSGGYDRINGGLGWDVAVQNGQLADYTLGRELDAVTFAKKSLPFVALLDRMTSVEMVRFDSGPHLYIAKTDAMAVAAHIATQWLGRDLTVAEGEAAMQQGSLSALDAAQTWLQGPNAAQLAGHSAQELIAGWQNNAQIVRMNVASEWVQGGAGFDAVRIGERLDTAHLERSAPGQWQSMSLRDGAMLQLSSIERVHLMDASVALDTESFQVAGQVAALMAVTLGNESLLNSAANRALAGIGLQAMDSGVSAQRAGEMALQYVQNQQGKVFSALDTVQWLWTHAMGSAGTQQQLQPYVQQLENGAITQGELAWTAAQYAQSAPSLELTGVLQHGLAYDLFTA